MITINIICILNSPPTAIAAPRKINERLGKLTIKAFNNMYARQVSEDEYEKRTSNLRFFKL